MISESTIQTAKNLNATLSKAGYVATPGKYETGSCAEFIRFTRPARANDNFGEIIRTETGWNTAFLSTRDLAKKVSQIVLEDVVARQATEQHNTACDRIDSM